MPTLLRILVLVPLGYVTACLGAAFVLTAAIYRLGDAAYPIDALAVAFWLFAAAWAGAFAALPTAGAVLLAELLGWRSLIGWLLFGGGLGAAAEIVARDVHSPLATGHPLRFVAAGIVGGAIYWFIAGRDLRSPGAPPRGIAKDPTRP